MPATKPSRLGRGLGNLISSGVSTASKPQPHEGGGQKEYTTLPLDKIQPNRFQPRDHFDDTQIGELVASIESEGLLQPISVRQTTEGKYEIIAGERRFRACQQLKKDSIPARILEVDDSSSAALALIENLQRTDLNPVEEAKGYQTLMAEFKLTQEKVSKRVGRSRTYVANALRLLQLDSSLQTALANSELSVGHAKVLLGLPDEAERQSLATTIIHEGLSVREAENRVRILKGGEVAQAARSIPQNQTTTAAPRPPQVGLFETSLSQKLQAPVSFKHGTSDRGRIVIDYKDMADLERVMVALGVG